jgi:hypothetical protein
VTEETNRSGRRGARRTARAAATALVLAGVAVLGLSACQVQPGAAAFVGGDRISKSQVDESVAKMPDQSQLDFGSARQRAVASLVVADLAQRVAHDQNVSLPAPDYADYADRLDEPASSTHLRAFAQADTYITALARRATPAKPSEDDLSTMLRFLQYSQGVDSTLTVDAVREDLDTPQTERLVAVRAELADAARKYHVSISPVYGSVTYLVQVPVRDGQYIGILTLPLSTAHNDLVTSPSPASGASSGTGESD